MQNVPGGVHTPQLALQHAVPAAQVELPHACVPSETQAGSPPRPTSQRVPCGQSTVAQGVITGVPTQSQTLGELSKLVPRGQVDV